jgi:hypothetical protein
MEPEGGLPSLDIQYAGDVGNGFTGITLNIFAESIEQVSESRRPSQPAEKTPMQVGQWPGLLLSVPSATRPVNHLRLLPDVGGQTVEVTTSAGTTGVPGEDANPLLQEDLLLSVVEQNLRPFP